MANKDGMATTLSERDRRFKDWVRSELLSLQAQINDLQSDQSMKALVTSVRDVAKAVREGSGGDTQGQQAQIDKLTRTIQEQRGVIRDAQDQPKTELAIRGKEETAMAQLNLQPLIDEVTSQTSELDNFVAFVAELKRLLAEAIANAVDIPAAQAAVDGVLATLLANKQKIVDAQAANVPPPTP